MVETGWLIELDQLCFGACGKLLVWVALTDEHAIRFSRRQDAEHILAWLRTGLPTEPFYSLTHCTVSEHKWG